MHVVRIAIAVAMVATAWLGLRSIVEAGIRGRNLRVLLLDAAPLLVAWGWLTCVLSRPILAAILVCAAALGIARGAAAKQRASGEPLVFTDRFQGSIFFYPSLYAEFVKRRTLAALALLVLASITMLVLAEPALSASPWPPVLSTALLIFLWLNRPSGKALLTWVGDESTARCSFDAAEDAKQMGPVSAVILHAAIAGVERPARRSHHLPCQSPALPSAREFSGPVVMLQLESFFDARRLWPVAPPDLLPAFDRCVARSDYHGRMATPAWGANTVRTEFAALTGISCAALGLDRFNPYSDFARVPIDSVAWRFRAAGFRTICVHPFSRRFYGRDRVMPHLGFDSFLDIADFGARDRGGAYVPDMEVVEKITAVLQRCGPKTFVFGITMGNHSPWQRLAPNELCAGPEDAALHGYLAGLRLTDAALGEMADRLTTDWPGAVLAAFGDHQPSLSRDYSTAGDDDRATDYLIMRAVAGRAERLDVPAHRLPGLVLSMSSENSRKLGLCPKPHQRPEAFGNPCMGLGPQPHVG